MIYNFNFMTYTVPTKKKIDFDFFKLLPLYKRAIDWPLNISLLKWKYVKFNTFLYENDTFYIAGFNVSIKCAISRGHEINSVIWHTIGFLPHSFWYISMHQKIWEIFYGEKNQKMSKNFNKYSDLI